MPITFTPGLTMTTGLSFLDSPLETGSMSFTGAAGQYLGLGGQTQFALGTGNFTIEAWFRATTFTGFPTIIDFRPASTNGVYPAIYIDTSGNLIYQVSAASQITKSGITLNTWFHVAVVKASNVTKMYVNGVYTGTSYTDNNNYLVGANRPLIGQAAFALNSGFPGNITNLRIVKGIAVYTSDFTVSAVPLGATQSANQYGNPSAAITGTETSLLMKASTSGTLATDSSTNNFSVSNVGTVTWSDLSPFVTTSGIVPVADAAFTAQGWSTGTNYTTITNGGTGAWNHTIGVIQGASGGARSIALTEGGSFYFEVQYIGQTNPFLLYGMCRSSSTGGYDNVPCLYGNDGTPRGGMTGGTNVGVLSPGDIMRYAYNTTTNKVWLGRNANWYLDPTSTAGTTIPGTGTLQLIFMAGSSGGSSSNGKFRKASENTFSTPTGFTACSL